jgi:cytochrome c oxidase assembly factor CtaG
VILTANRTLLDKVAMELLATASALEFGFTPLEDQQLGGLVMWVPAGTIYAVVAFAMFGFWIASTSGKRPANAAKGAVGMPRLRGGDG